MEWSRGIVKKEAGSKGRGGRATLFTTHYQTPRSKQKKMMRVVSLGKRGYSNMSIKIEKPGDDR